MEKIENLRSFAAQDQSDLAAFVLLSEEEKEFVLIFCKILRYQDLQKRRDLKISEQIHFNQLVMRELEMLEYLVD